MKSRLAFAFVLTFISINLFAQNNQQKNYDLSTVDGIIHRLYDVISGPAGEDRDWNAFTDLFSENARMYIALNNDDGSHELKSITPQQYIDRNKTRLADIGFNETELYRITNAFGAGTQVLSTYETQFTNTNGEQEITKGINNIQLYFDGKRYYIASIFWNGDAKDLDVPEKYLPKGRNTEYQVHL